MSLIKKSNGLYVCGILCKYMYSGLIGAPGIYTNRGCLDYNEVP